MTFWKTNLTLLYQILLVTRKNPELQNPELQNPELGSQKLKKKKKVTFS